MEIINALTEEILQNIISIQKDAYNRISRNNLNWEDKWFLMQFQSSEEELQSMAQNKLNFYNRLSENTGLIHLTSEEELATMRHILFRMEDVWVKENPEGVAGCWELFFSIEEQRQPKIKYIKKQLKLYQNGNRNY